MFLFLKKDLEDRVVDTFWRSGASLLGKRISANFLSGAVPAFLVRCRLLVGTDSGSRWVGHYIAEYSDAVLLSRVGGRLYSALFCTCCCNGWFGNWRRSRVRLMCIIR